MKPCPFCGEPIRDNATKCRFCKEWLVSPRGSGALPFQQKARGRGLDLEYVRRRLADMPAEEFSAVDGAYLLPEIRVIYDAEAAGRALAPEAPEAPKVAHLPDNLPLAGLKETTYPPMRCAICRDDVAGDQPLKRCEACAGAFHLECWKDNGGCATTGCSNAPKKDDAQIEAGLQETYWGATTKACPACAETINVNERVCPKCNEHFATDRPMSFEEYKAGFARPQVPSDLEQGALIMFISGIVGVTAPVSLLLGGLWYRAHKDALRELSPLHHLLAVCGLVISALYCVIIAVVLL
jgi:hypothetical protein